MSSCKPLSSKIAFGNRFQCLHRQCEGPFPFVPFERGSTNLLMVPPNSTAGRDIKELTPIHTLSAIIIPCPGHLFSTAVSFLFSWVFFLYFIGKGQLEKGKKDGGLTLFRGIFCFLFLHMHVYFCLFFKCPNSVYKDLTSVIVGTWQCFITTSKLLFFTYQRTAGGN